MSMRLAIATTIVAFASGLAPVAGIAGAESGATDMIVEVAVDANRQPANGYHQVQPPPDSVGLSDCSRPSPAAVSQDIYACDPSAAAADVCWPAAASVLCLDDPWNKELRRYNYASVLPHVQPPATPQPLALLLDDGTRCRLRNGGAWGARADGLVGAYGCGLPNSTLAVLVPPDQGVQAIDRSQPLWTVKVGDLGNPETQFPPPQIHMVTTAWFAGDYSV
jgi:hypothetical protein